MNNGIPRTFFYNISVLDDSSSFYFGTFLAFYNALTDNKKKIELDTNLTLFGQVIEIQENKGVIIAKIACSPGLITIPIITNPEIHLNDLIKIEGKIIIDNISFDLNEDNSINIEMN